MELSIEEQAKKDAMEIWENKLKSDFEDHINNCLMDTLKELKVELNNFEQSMKSHLSELDQKFQKKYNDQKSLLQQNNNSMNMNPFNQFNNNINNYNENIIETDDLLRKKEINLREIIDPNLKKLNLPLNSNPLINLILYSLANMKCILFYYFNPAKEEKIMQKSSGEKNYLGPAYLKLIDHYWKSRKNEFQPDEMHQVLKNLLHNNYVSQNPGLIIENILTILNSELESNPINNLKYDFNSDLSYNQKEVWDFFSSQHNRIPTKIKNCFYSYIQTEKICSLCKQVQYLLKIGPIINLYLEANPNINNNNISLLNHFENLLTSRNEKVVLNEYCKYCNCNKNKNISNYFLSANENIIFNINRDADPNNMVQLNYPDQLPSEKLINKKRNFLNMKKSKYDLFCIIRKVQTNNNNSSFIMHCKNPINCKWYTYDNNQIIQENNILLASHDVYLLIYQTSNQQN